MYKVLAIVTAAVAFLAATQFATTSVDIDAEFTKFVQENRRSYFSAEEYSFRKMVFADNLDKIAELNADPVDMALYGVNMFADQTEEEKKSVLGLSNQEERFSGLRFQPDLSEELPTTVDWTDLEYTGGVKVISGIKNQGSCGSCWAFGSTLNLEAELAIHE